MRVHRDRITTNLPLRSDSIAVRLSYEQRESESSLCLIPRDEEQWELIHECPRVRSDDVRLRSHYTLKEIVAHGGQDDIRYERHFARLLVALPSHGELLAVECVH